MRTFFALLLLIPQAAFGAAPGQLYQHSPWGVRRGLEAWYDHGDPLTLTLNGAGISRVADKSWVPGRRENLLVQSETFNTTWTRERINAFGATDTGATGAGSFANTTRTLDPLGGNTADFIQEDSTAANSHQIYQLLTVPSGPVSLSICVKAAGRTFLRLFCVPAGGGVRIWFDVQNGVVGTVTQVNNPTAVSTSITDLGDGWYRCQVNFTGAGGTGTALVVATSTGDNVTTYDGDNTSGLFLWGAQLRRTTSSSVYFPTTTTIADASHDLLQATAANQPTWTNDVSFPLPTAVFNGTSHYLKTAPFTLVQPTTVVWVGKQVTWTSGDTFLDGNAVNSSRFWQTTASPKIGIYDGATDLQNTNLVVGSFGVVTIVNNTSSSSLSVNNTQPITGSLTGNMGGLTLGTRGDLVAGFSNAQVSQVLIYNRVLNASELAAIKRWAQSLGGAALVF